MKLGVNVLNNIMEKKMKNEIFKTRYLVVQVGLVLGLVNAVIAFSTQNLWFAIPAIGLLVICISDYAKLREDRKVFDKSAVKYFDGDNT
jgi:bacteriorhodopsin